MKEKYYFFVRTERRACCMTENELKGITELEGDRERLSGNVVTVCVKDDGEEKGRGISPCSPNDVFDMDTGKFHARCKAERAMKQRPNSEEIVVRPEAIRVLLRTACPFAYNGEWCPDFSFFELQLLYGRKAIMDNAESNMKTPPKKRNNSNGYFEWTKK